MSPFCKVCQRTLGEGINLYRQNEKGVPAVWACAVHSKPIDEELVNIVGQLQKGNGPGKND